MSSEAAPGVPESIPERPREEASATSQGHQAGTEENQEQDDNLGQEQVFDVDKEVADKQEELYRRNQQAYQGGMNPY